MRERGVTSPPKRTSRLAGGPVFPWRADRQKAHGPARICRSAGVRADTARRTTLSPPWRERPRSPRLHRRGPIEASARRPILPSWRSLHGFTAVAPLKQDQSLAERWKDAGLHGFTAVAPLKLIHTSEPTDDTNASPRLHRRGPIEASWAQASRRAMRSSPRLHRRGPIEAWYVSRRCNHRRCLHGFTAVAPLKRHEGLMEGCLYNVSTASPPW